MKKSIVTLLLTFSLTAAFSQKAIYVDKKGKGSPILFLPGFTTPGSVWNETIKNIASQHENHVVSYAGFNGLEPIGTPWYESIKNQLIKYVRKENLHHLTIIGHSMGGDLAIELAAELGDDVESLILIESIPCMREVMMPGVPASSLQYDSPYNNQMLQMSDESFKQMATGMSQGMTNDTSKIKTLVNWILQADKKTYVYGYTDLLKLDLRENLKSIQANTLILGASFPDKNTVLATFEKQYANLSSKKILIADNSKHFIMFDQPEWLYKNINSFLADNGQD